MLSVSDPCIFEQSKPLHPELVASWSRDFCFDRVLWNDVGGQTDSAGQAELFAEVGEPVLDWILNGFNCCVFAFGQTGGGKTHSMMGKTRGVGASPDRHGLIPRICCRLFEALEEASAGDSSAEMAVTFSHMEIYNELVKDLLVSPAERGASLRVREHPQKGVFVLNLTQVRVASFEHILALMMTGDKNRTVGATDMNAHSSRSHAIVTLTVVQRCRERPVLGLPTSALRKKDGRVHLVDLAGSERVSNTGAKGTRLKEASNINRSLSVLGDVILSLASGKRGHIPYRNSTLTMVLKDSLGGNAHAIMVTAISPSSADYEETLSTLKYADRAKKVRMRVDANITTGLLATDSSALALVPLLQAEVQKLREMLRLQQEQQQAFLSVSQQAARSREEELRERDRSRAEREAAVAKAVLVVSTAPTAASSSPSSSSALLMSPPPPPPPPPLPAPTLPSPAASVTEAVVPLMWERLRELERQLADRERLIESLEGMREQQAQQGLAHAQHAHNAQHPYSAQGGGAPAPPAYPNGPPSHYAQPYPSLPTPGYYPFYHSEDYSFQEPYYEEKEVFGTSTFLPLGASSATPNKDIGHRQLDAAAATNETRVGTSESSHAPAKGGKGDDADADSNPLPVMPDVQRTRPLVVLADDAVDATLPRVINLNQDPLFSECLVYYLPPGQVLAGSRESDADIVLSGPDILARHAVLLASLAGQVVIRVCQGALVFLNGNIVEANSSAVLRHHDRIAFGCFHLFRFEHLDDAQPSGGDAAEVNTSNASQAKDAPGWEFAQQELMSKSSQRRSAQMQQQHAHYQQQHVSAFSPQRQLPVYHQSPPSPAKKSTYSIYRPNPIPNPNTNMNLTSYEFNEPTLSALAFVSHSNNSPAPSNGSTPFSSPSKAQLSSDANWWARVNHVAEGSATADPLELRDMLRTLVEKAESSRGRGSSLSGTGTVSGISSGQGLNQSVERESRDGVSGAAAAAGVMWARGLGAPIHSQREGSGAPSSPPRSPPLSPLRSPPRAASSYSTYADPSPVPSLSPAPAAHSFSAPARFLASPPPPPSRPLPYPVPATTSSTDSSDSSRLDRLDPSPNPNPNPNPLFNPPAPLSPSSDTSGFEKEAFLLSQELAGMQKSLRDRMARYAVLSTEYALPNPL